MFVSWEEVVAPKKINGNKIKKGDCIKLRGGEVFSHSGPYLAVKCDDNSLRCVNLETNDSVKWHEPEEEENAGTD